MARNRHRLVRRVGFAAVAVGMTSIVGLVIAAGMSLATATDRVGDLSYFLTGAANAHREVQKMEVAGRGSTPADMDEIILRRQFTAQQLRLTMPGLTERADPNPRAPVLLADLARLDELIAGNGRNPPTPELADAITTVEIDLKRIYDSEGFRYFALNRAAIAAKNRSETFLLLLGAAITISGIALLCVLRHSAKNNLRAKAEELTAALTSLEASEAARSELIDEMGRATERERTRVAADLHDGPIQALAALCFRLDRADSKLTRGDTQAASSLVTSARAELGDEVAELRRIMSELRPPALDENGLAGATRDYVEAFAARTGITTDIEIAVEAAPSPEREVLVYRLVQEALTNVKKHSHAQRVLVKLQATGDHIELWVIDNGTGFDMGEMADHVRNSHYGLAGMRERVTGAGGEFSVISAAGAGVRLRAWLPTEPRSDGEPLDGNAA